MIETVDLPPSDSVLGRHEVRAHTTRIVAEMPVIDMHTHLFPLQFDELASWGIDDLLTYHYLVAEMMRSADVRPQRFQAMSKASQADLVWETLFVRNTPLSEATLGVIAVLSALGLDPARRDLREARDFFRAARPAEHLAWILDRARIYQIVMTNDPFDPREAPVWRRSVPIDARFRAALRLDTLLNDWETARHALEGAGHEVGSALDDQAILTARRFIDGWIVRMNPLYLAVSLPDDFTWPAENPRARLIRDVVLPACREHRLPFAMMIGVRRGVNPTLRDAGDARGEQYTRLMDDGRPVTTREITRDVRRLFVENFQKWAPLGHAPGPARTDADAAPDGVAPR